MADFLIYSPGQGLILYGPMKQKQMSMSIMRNAYFQTIVDWSSLMSSVDIFYNIQWFS